MGQTKENTPRRRRKIHLDVTAGMMTQLNELEAWVAERMGMDTRAAVLRVVMARGIRQLQAEKVAEADGSARR